MEKHSRLSFVKEADRLTRERLNQMRSFGKGQISQKLHLCGIWLRNLLSTRKLPKFVLALLCSICAEAASSVQKEDEGEVVNSEKKKQRGIRESLSHLFSFLLSKQHLIGILALCVLSQVSSTYCRCSGKDKYFSTLRHSTTPSLYHRRFTSEAASKHKTKASHR